MSSKNDGAIGIFDSGMGGLSVLREVARLLPSEDIIYFADGANCPYGTKSPEQITELTMHGIERLLGQGVKMIIVACNTATTYAIEALRQSYDVPFVAIEPAVKPAARATRSGKVAVLATAGTLSGERLKRLCQSLNSSVEVVTAVGEGFVELVESDQEGSSAADTVVSRVVAPLIERGVDQIVLGCTHYPFLVSSIERAIGSQAIEIINPAEAVAARAEDILVRNGIKSKNSREGKITFTNSLSEEYNHHLEIKFNKYRN